MVVDTLTVSLNFQTLKYTIKGNEFSRLKGYLTCRLRIPSEVRTYISKLEKVRNFLQRLVRKLTGDYDDNHELPAMNLGMIAVALTPSWLGWIWTVMPAWLYFSSFLFSVLLFFSKHENIYMTWVLAVFDYYYRRQAYDLTDREIFKTGTVHFVFSLIIFVSAHLCLVLLLQLASSQISISINGKKLERSPGNSRT